MRSQRGRRVTHDDLSVRNCSICLAIHEQALLLIQGCGVREQLVVVGVSGHSRSRQLVLHIADVDELAVAEKGKVGIHGDLPSDRSEAHTSELQSLMRTSYHV